jgi:hypothetical protein
MALAEIDRQTLEEPHIDLDEVASEIAELIRRERDLLVSPMSDALSEPERAFLQRSVAAGFDPIPSESKLYSNIRSIASEHAKMTAQAYTQKQVADLLQVTAGRIRQRIATVAYMPWRAVKVAFVAHSGSLPAKDLAWPRPGTKGYQP